MRRRNREQNEDNNEIQLATVREAPVKQQPMDEDDMVATGLVYREKEGEREVMPFFVDYPTGRVRFSPVGIGSGREDEMRMADFLKTYEAVEQSSLAEASPADSQKAAEKRQEAARKEAERK